VFDVNGARLFLPSDPEGPFDETANCRCFVEYVDEGVGAEEAFDDIRSVELAGRIARLRGKYGVGLNDSLRRYPPEQREALFGRKLSESETIRNIEDFEAELDRTRALGSARGKDWTLSGLRRVKTDLGDREPKSPEELNRLGQVNSRGDFEHSAGQTILREQTILFKPELSEDDVRELAGRGLVGPMTMFARESERTQAAARRYVIRHELGHALQNAKGPISAAFDKAKTGAARKLSARAAVGLDQPGKDDLNELVAELFAWYTSPDYDGSLDAMVEAALDDLMR
jgi:hypothetical protein